MPKVQGKTLWQALVWCNGDHQRFTPLGALQAQMRRGDPGALAHKVLPKGHRVELPRRVERAEREVAAAQAVGCIAHHQPGLNGGLGGCGTRPSAGGCPPPQNGLLQGTTGQQPDQQRQSQLTIGCGGTSLQG